MTMLKQDSRPMSSTSYARSNNDHRLRNNPNPRSRSSADTPPSSPNQSGSRSRSRSSRSCCFSCCGLTVRSNPDPPRTSRGGNGTKLESKAAPQDLDLQPTAEDVRLWGESFDNVMATACGRKWFRDFLRCEYSEENILFWLACEDLKKETNPDIVEEKARIIYEDYISILSPKEVSLDSRVREMVNRNMVEPSRHTFDEAQLQIFTLMHRDSYPRFVNSQQYRTLVDKYLKNTAKPPATNNSAGASTQQPQRTQSSSSSNSQNRAGSTG